MTAVNNQAPYESHGHESGRRPRTELAEHRQATGWSQQNLADHLGIHRTTIYRWEAGISTPRPYQRDDLAKALKITVFELAALIEPTPKAPKVSKYRRPHMHRPHAHEPTQPPPLSPSSAQLRLWEDDAA